MKRIMHVYTVLFSVSGLVVRHEIKGLRLFSR